MPAGAPAREFNHRLKRAYGLFALGFIVFVLGLAMAERAGLPRVWIGYAFIAATIGMYAVIGAVCRTTDAVEYYVAGRRVPAMFNGMATAADWISAASFVGLAGTLYWSGFDGLAFVMGWTGGYCLVAFFIAPYLSRFGRFTIPDFFAARYGGATVRLITIFAVMLCSFVYVVAQIYGVGLILTRLTGVSFEIGIFIGLSGMLMCSFLGGMKAVTWTQVAQYIIIIIAYITPVMLLSFKHSNLPIPQVVYGQALQGIAEREKQIFDDPKEAALRQHQAARAATLRAMIDGLPESLERERIRSRKVLDDLRAAQAPASDIARAGKALRNVPANVATARAAWNSEMGMALNVEQAHAHAAVFPGKNQDASDAARRNFIALLFCLMLGTAGLPHILTRYYTPPSVKEARLSVFWSLFFIFLLYVSAPALAVFVKYEIYEHLVGSEFSRLPAWVAQWSRIDGGSLLSVVDINQDGIVQLAEVAMHPDIIMLAMPEIAGFPYIIAGLVAAGGLAAALSTADSLLLTIANALSHDLYYGMINRNVSTANRVAISKMALMLVASAAAIVASQRPGNILFMVSAAFSLAASGLFPALVLGIFWKRTSRAAASLGMMTGLSVCFYYMSITHPWLRDLFFVKGEIKLWWDIQPISAGIFGVPAGFAVTVLASLVSPKATDQTSAMVDSIRYPGADDKMTGWRDG